MWDGDLFFVDSTIFFDFFLDCLESVNLLHLVTKDEGFGTQKLNGQKAVKHLGKTLF